jgi:hypothetical protein
MEANLELTEVDTDFIDYLINKYSSHYLVTDDDINEGKKIYKGYPYDSVIKTDIKIKYTAREFKREMKDLYAQYNPTDTFYSDSLHMKVSRIFFYKVLDSHTKRPVYKLRDYESILKRCGISGISGDSSKNLIEKGNSKLFKKSPLTPLTPQPLDYRYIPHLEGLNPSEIRELDFSEYAGQIREDFISNTIIRSNRILFYYKDTLVVEDKHKKVDKTTRPVELIEDEPCDETDNINEDDFIPVEVSTLYFNETKEDKFNRTFDIKSHIKNLGDFRNVVLWDNTGCKFHEDIAKNENFEETDMLLVDVDAHDDEDLSNIEDIDKLGYEYYRVTSKSGNGYHFYFPLSHVIDNIDYFKTAINRLLEDIESIGLHPDYACRNASRKFYSTRHMDTAIRHKGGKFNVISALKGTATPKSVKNEVKNRVKNVSKQSEMSNSSDKLHTLIPRDELLGKNDILSENNLLTDQYFMGRVNHHHVVEDLPHIIGYLNTLFDNDKEFFSPSLNERVPIDEVIEQLKRVLEYDPSHVQYIITLWSSFRGEI